MAWAPQKPSQDGLLQVLAGTVRRLLVTGLSLLAIGVLWLTQVPADASYVSDLLPAFLLAGVAIGLCAPSAQSTVLVSRTGLSGFHAAFVVISVAAALGALVAAAGFQRHSRPAERAALDAHARTGTRRSCRAPSSTYATSSPNCT